MTLNYGIIEHRCFMGKAIKRMQGAALRNLEYMSDYELAMNLSEKLNKNNWGSLL